MQSKSVLGTSLAVLALGIGAALAGCAVETGEPGVGEGEGEAVDQAEQAFSYIAGYDVSSQPLCGTPCGAPIRIYWTAPSGHSASDWIAIKYQASNGAWTPFTVVASAYAGSTATWGYVDLPVKCDAPNGPWRVEYWPAGYGTLGAASSYFWTTGAAYPIAGSPCP